MIEKVLKNLKIASLNEMQRVAISSASSKDTIILSPTGSGKTIAFLIPVLSRLDQSKPGIQAMILVPSRELALQIEQVFKAMGTGFKVNCFYGGHPVKTEKNNLTQAPSVLIGTPGRIAYHIRHENFNPDDIHTLVLDEFDKALEFGFEDDMAFIISRMKNVGRRILTSATKMPEIPSFTGLGKSAEVNFLSDSNSLPDLIIKTVVSDAADKLETLFSLICKIGNRSTLVFCNHREAVDRISALLWNMGLDHGVFHGGMEQEDREKALLKFRNGSYRFLITTDLASRGLDIPEIEFVVHYQLPHNEEAFLHRNGRTARMNSSGTAYVILTEDEKPSFLKDKTEIEILPEKNVVPENTSWATLYLGAGRKDKINKIDIVGLLMKKGKLEKDELGLIEVQDYASYAGVSRKKIGNIVKLLKDEKIKNKKIKIEVSR
ncbi:ATP-independent RNA helicase DbpA [Daejeonella rubra]|uniref:ATP-independent RNA helicase DbpA n=1 Tax=Daejeonella rubra TaxID=990371 RepID=A0A1G9N5W9_9SPHI|nr:DEAD/DEAH box helicase [Daejeonella rubra]SDL81783.1 ATP-independent RNA helicase DbpA [Daejeonella rubra]